MGNKTEKKWYQKPITVVLFLIFFFPVGLLLMWKHEVWSKTARWIISGVFALAVIANTSKDNSTTEDGNSKYNSTVKVTFDEAEAFMERRCMSINQTLMKKKVSNFNGTKLYMFLSVAENGSVCISAVSEHELEVLSSDCGSSESKIQQWNAL